jgi:hypothetical protein
MVERTMAERAFATKKTGEQGCKAGKGVPS